MSDAGTPRIGVGLPVFNEGRHLAATLDCLLAQTRPPDDILVADNGSTDDTRAVAEHYAALHPAIRYHRHPHNIGATGNFRHVLEETACDYFMWCAGHDHLSANLIERCAAALVAHPGAVLCAPRSAWMDDAGHPLARSSGHCDTRGMELLGRYVTVLWGNMHPIYGLIRRETLLRVRFDAYVGADLAILAQLALIGDFLVADDALWTRRDSRQESGYADKLARYRSAQFALARSPLARVAPLARLPLELMRGIAVARLPLTDRAALFACLLVNLPLRLISGLRQYRRTRA